MSYEPPLYIRVAVPQPRSEVGHGVHSVSAWNTSLRIRYSPKQLKIIMQAASLLPDVEKSQFVRWAALYMAKAVIKDATGVEVDVGP